MMNKIDLNERYILKAYVLQKSRAYLIAHPEIQLTVSEQKKLSSLIQRRISGEPIAYILSKRSFWTMDLKVTQSVLIPRHETELLVEMVLKTLPKEEPLSILELGTGSGAIAIALALERPQWTITATDISMEALRIASDNAEIYQRKNICFLQSDWFEALKSKCFHAIVSNPPYLSQNDPHLLSGDLRYEPKTALVSGQDGLNAIRLIITKSKDYLRSGGSLFIEHGYDQDNAVKKIMESNHYTEIKLIHDLNHLPRMTVAKVAG